MNYSDTKADNTNPLTPISLCYGTTFLWPKPHIHNLVSSSLRALKVALQSELQYSQFF